MKRGVLPLASLLTSRSVTMHNKCNFVDANNKRTAVPALIFTKLTNTPQRYVLTCSIAFDACVPLGFGDSHLGYRCFMSNSVVGPPVASVQEQLACFHVTGTLDLFAADRNAMNIVTGAFWQHCASFHSRVPAESSMILNNRLKTKQIRNVKLFLYLITWRCSSRPS